MQIGFNFADFLIQQKIDDYLDVDQVSQKVIDQNVEAFLAEAQYDLFPEYARFLEEKAEITDSKTWNREKVTQSIKEIRQLLDLTTRKSSPYIANILIAHQSPDKLSYMTNAIVEERREKEEEFADLDIETYNQERAERRISFISDFTGDLTTAQEDVIIQASQNEYSLYQRWLENRKARQDALINYMKEQPNPAALEMFIYDLIIKHTIVDSDYKEVSESKWKNLEEIFYQILITMNNKQARQFSRNLRSYASDFRDIATQKIAQQSTLQVREN